MQLIPQNEFNEKYIRLYQSSNSLLIRLLGTALIALLILWFKGFVFGWLARVTGLSLMQDLSEGSLLFWILLILYGFGALLVALRWRTTCYEVRKGQIIIEKGILAKQMISVDIHEFGQVKLDVGIIGRLLRFGSIIFEYKMLGPAGDLGITFYNIHDPRRYMEYMGALVKGGMLGKGGDKAKEYSEKLAAGTKEQGLEVPINLPVIKKKTKDPAVTTPTTAPTQPPQPSSQPEPQPKLEQQPQPEESAQKEIRGEIQL